MSKRRAYFSLACILIGFGLAAADVALAQEKEHGATTAAAATPLFGDMGLKGFGTAIGAGLVVTGGAWGISRIGSSAVRSMARMPEVAGTINTATLITAAMIEGATLFAVVVLLLMAL